MVPAQLCWILHPLSPLYQNVWHRDYAFHDFVVMPKSMALRVSITILILSHSPLLLSLHCRNLPRGSGVNMHAAIVPRVTCDLPTQHIPFKAEWNHLTDLTLADPDFGRPGKIDLLLGVDVFSQVVRQGRRSGVPGSPSAFETEFGCVLAGETNTCVSHLSLTSYHTAVYGGDGLLR